MRSTTPPAHRNYSSCCARHCGSSPTLLRPRTGVGGRVDARSRFGTGYQCLGFVWEDGVMRPLPTLGGTNGFATGANNKGQIVGWAENTVHDPTCVAPQVLQFRAVVWGRLPGEAEADRHLRSISACAPTRAACPVRRSPARACGPLGCHDPMSPVASGQPSGSSASVSAIAHSSSSAGLRRSSSWSRPSATIPRSDSTSDEGSVLVIRVILVRPAKLTRPAGDGRRDGGAAGEVVAPVVSPISLEAGRRIVRKSRPAARLLSDAWLRRMPTISRRSAASLGGTGCPSP